MLEAPYCSETLCPPTIAHEVRTKKTKIRQNARRASVKPLQWKL
jgi:hypothetical protein